MNRSFRNRKILVVSVLLFLATLTFFLASLKNVPPTVSNKLVQISRPSFQTTSKNLSQVRQRLIPISDRLALIPNPNKKANPDVSGLFLIESTTVVHLASGPDKLGNMGWNDPASDKMPIANTQTSAILHQRINLIDHSEKIVAHQLAIEKEALVSVKTNKNVGTSSTDFNNFDNNILTSEMESYQKPRNSIPVQSFEPQSTDKADGENLKVRHFISDTIQEDKSLLTRESMKQYQQHRMDDRDIHLTNSVMNESAQYKQYVRNSNTRSQYLPVKGKQVQILTQEHITDSSSLTYYNDPHVKYHSSSTTISTHSIIDDNKSRKFHVQNFAAFNLTHTENMKHIYTLRNQYPSSESRSFPCIPTRTIPSFTICVFSVQKDIYVSGSLQETGIWDLKQTTLIQRALNGFPEAIFIDVGANIGYFSLLARAMGRDVIAIEPTDANFLRLQEGVIRNNFSGNILILKYAISDKRTTVIMGEDYHNQGGVAVAREIDGPADIPRSVETITLDDLVKLVLAKEIIIKMDIEGYECKALYSSMKLLQKFKVRYMFMEWLIMPQNQYKKDTPCPKEAILRTLANMHSMGFKPYSVHGPELDINNSGSWKTSDIYWKPYDSPTLD